MSRYILRVFESKSICPKCKDILKSMPDEVFGEHYVCINCGATYYCISPGITEHEFSTSDNYSEALTELAALDDLK